MQTSVEGVEDSDIETDAREFQISRLLCRVASKASAPAEHFVPHRTTLPSQTDKIGLLTFFPRGVGLDAIRLVKKLLKP